MNDGLSLMSCSLNAFVRGATALLGKPIRVRKGSVSVPPEPDDWHRLTTEATVAVTGFGG